jgi:hypothetical protein
MHIHVLHIHTHTQINVYICIHIYTCTYTYTRIHIHTHIHAQLLLTSQHHVDPSHGHAPHLFTIIHNPSSYYTGQIGAVATTYRAVVLTAFTTGTVVAAIGTVVTPVVGGFRGDAEATAAIGADMMTVEGEGECMFLYVSVSVYRSYIYIYIYMIIHDKCIYVYSDVFMSVCVYI